MPPSFAIAHVTPYPWEMEVNDVNAYVRRAAGELSRRGHHVLVLAPSRSQERVRASRRALRAARGAPQALLEGTDRGSPRVVAVGEVIDVVGATRRRPSSLPIDVARTVEELLGTVDDRRTLAKGRLGLPQVDLGGLGGPLDQLLERRSLDVLQFLFQVHDRAGLGAGAEVHLVEFDRALDQR